MARRDKALSCQGDFHRVGASQQPRPASDCTHLPGKAGRGDKSGLSGPLSNRLPTGRGGHGGSHRLVWSSSASGIDS